MQIVPGVVAVSSLGVGRAYLCIDDDRITLVDTGLRGSAVRIARAVHAVGLHPRAIRRIIITHHHGDHAGSLATIARLTGAEVLVHRLDAPVVQGKRPPPGPSTTTLLKPLVERLAHRAAPALVSRELEDGDEIDTLGGLRVLHTPGHTAGSISLYNESRRLIFTGDAAANLVGVRLSPGPFTEDRDEARRSLSRLAALPLDVACFGHGRPIVGGAGRHFQRLAGRPGGSEQRSLS